MRSMRASLMSQCTFTFRPNRLDYALVTDMAFTLRDEELGKEQAEFPSTEKEIEVAKRELRFVHRSTVNKLHQTMEKLKHFLEFRGKSYSDAFVIGTSF